MFSFNFHSLEQGFSMDFPSRRKSYAGYVTDVPLWDCSRDHLEVCLTHREPFRKKNCIFALW